MPSAIFTLCCSFKEFMRWCSHDAQLVTWYLLSCFPTICTYVLQNSNVSHLCALRAWAELDELESLCWFLIRIKGLSWDDIAHVTRSLPSSKHLHINFILGRSFVQRLKQCPRNWSQLLDPGTITKGIGVLVFLLKCVAPPSCLFPSSQLMVKTEMNRLNILGLFQSIVRQVVLDPDVPHEDTALSPGQRWELLQTIFLTCRIERKWGGPSWIHSLSSWPLLTFPGGHEKSLLTSLHFSFPVIKKKHFLPHGEILRTKP